MDNKTLTIAIAIINLFFTINVFITSIQRKSKKLYFLCSAFLSLALGYTFVVLCENSGLKVAGMVFNFFFGTFFILYYAGVRSYGGLKSWPLRFWIYLLANFLAQILVAAFYPVYSLRVTMISATIVLIFADAFFSMIPIQQKVKRSTRLIVLIFIFGYPIYVLVRLVIVILSQESEKFLTDSSTESTVTLVFMMISSGVYAAVATIVDNRQFLAILKSKNDQSLSMVEQLRINDENKNKFLSVLSHELRNPLASISMGLSLLSNQVPEGDSHTRARVTMDSMGRQILNLTRLVDDLLDINRINQQKIVLKKEPVNLNLMLQQILNDCRWQFVDKGIRLTDQIAISPLVLSADPVRLTQVVSNLLHNALKFTETGGEVTLALARTESYTTSQPQEIILQVCDSGIGIEPSLLPNLFEPFRQIDQSLQREFGGLGLGLVIARSIIALHGGSIEVASQGTGLGSAFTVRLPYVPLRPEPAVTFPVVKNIHQANLRILVIEDNLDLNAILCEMLESEGHQIAQATTGCEGIAKAKTFKPDVIICDIGLSDLDGYAVASRLREDTLTRSIYLIAFSGYARPADIDRSKAAGFDRHLAKPVNYPQLYKILAEVPEFARNL